LNRRASSSFTSRAFITGTKTLGIDRLVYVRAMMILVVLVDRFLKSLVH